MIISEIKWGLGNQLFQYAAGLSLASYHNVPLILDITNFEEDFDREFGLKYFEINDIKTEIESDNDVTFNLFLNNQYPFEANFFKNSSFTYLSGNWQSEKYFIDIKDKIIERYRVKPQYIKQIDFSSLKIHEGTAVSIHIRRTDYSHHFVLDILPLSYYYEAIKYFTEQFDDIKFYIFSDDIAWVVENLKLDAEHVFVSENYTKHNIEDFYLMQQCKHHIIANSTFSWWAAWLCAYPNKIVMTPAKWFSKGNVSTRDLIPGNWLTI